MALYFSFVFLKKVAGGFANQDLFLSKDFEERMELIDNKVMIEMKKLLLNCTYGKWI